MLWELWDVQGCRKYEMKKYIAKPGAQFSKKDAQKFGTYIDKLHKKHTGVTPTVLVEDAANPKSPLHGYFNWDDSDAAHKFRVEQARHLLNHLELVVTVEGRDPTPIKGFFNVKSPTGSPVYVSFETVKNDAQLRLQVLEDAFNELVYWKSRYEEYQEFGEVVMAIETTRKKLFGKKKK